MHAKIQAMSFFKDPNSLVAMHCSIMSHYEIYRAAFYPVTIKTFITGLPLCKISWCIEQLHIATHKTILRMFFSSNRVLTAFVQYRIILFSAWFCFQPHYQAEKNTYHLEMSAEENKSKAH